MPRISSCGQGPACDEYPCELNQCPEKRQRRLYGNTNEAVVDNASTSKFHFDGSYDIDTPPVDQIITGEPGLSPALRRALEIHIRQEA